MAPADYRERIYRSFVSVGRLESPVSVLDFEPLRPYLTRLIRRHFPADRQASILELGCGHGALIYFATQAGYQNMEGIDTSPEQVACAARLGIAGVRLGDAMQTLAAAPDGSRDVIVCYDLIEHLVKPELIDFADSAHRVLRRGGTLILHTVNAESPFGSRIRYGDFTHELAFTRQSIGQLLLSAGFRDVRCFEHDPVVHGIKSAVRWTLWKAIRCGLLLWLAAETGELTRSPILTQAFLAVATRG